MRNVAETAQLTYNGIFESFPNYRLAMCIASVPDKTIFVQTYDCICRYLRRIYCGPTLWRFLGLYPLLTVPLFTFAHVFTARVSLSIFSFDEKTTTTSLVDMRFYRTSAENIGGIASSVRVGRFLQATWCSDHETWTWTVVFRNTRHTAISVSGCSDEANF
jgi:hypothetical protein